MGTYLSTYKNAQKTTWNGTQETIIQWLPLEWEGGRV